VSACAGGTEINPDAQVMLAKAVENTLKVEVIDTVIEVKVEEKVEIAKAKFEYKCTKCSKSFESDKELADEDMLCEEHNETDEDNTVEEAVETPPVTPETVTTAKAIEIPTYFYYVCGPSKEAIAQGYINMNSARKN
jgi:hypothetical protein